MKKSILLSILCCVQFVSATSITIHNKAQCKMYVSVYEQVKIGGNFKKVIRSKSILKKKSLTFNVKLPKNNRYFVVATRGYGSFRRKFEDQHFKVFFPARRLLPFGKTIEMSLLERLEY